MMRTWKTKGGAKVCILYIPLDASHQCSGLSLQAVVMMPIGIIKKHTQTLDDDDHDLMLFPELDTCEMPATITFANSKSRF